MIALLDYGAGNVGSVLKAVRYLGFPAEVVSEPPQLLAAEKIILPGQGHFGNMLRALAGNGALEALRQALTAGKPYLGICLGLQASRLQTAGSRIDRSPGFLQCLLREKALCHQRFRASEFILSIAPSGIGLQHRLQRHRCAHGGLLGRPIPRLAQSRLGLLQGSARFSVRQTNQQLNRFDTIALTHVHRQDGRRDFGSKFDTGRCIQAAGGDHRLQQITALHGRHLNGRSALLQKQPSSQNHSEGSGG
jgi:hypothetical protein